MDVKWISFEEWQFEINWRKVMEIEAIRRHKELMAEIEYHNLCAKWTLYPETWGD